MLSMFRIRTLSCFLQQNLDTFRLIAFTAFGFNSIVQLFVLAYIGNSIESASDNMTTAFYEHDWINFDTGHKKNLIMVMINANYPMKLKVGKFFDVNLLNFLFVSTE